MIRRRGWEILVLAFGALFLALVVYSFRPGHRPASGRAGDTVPRPPSAQEGGQPMTVSKGFDYTETVGGKPVFRIQAERTVGFGPAAGLVPNVYALESVALTLYPDRGAPVTVRAEKAQYDHRTNEAVLSGNVRWSDEKGAIGETSRLEFHPSAHELTAPGVIHFARGTFNIQARSGRYDVPKHALSLAGPVSGSGTGEGSGGLSELAADGAVYRRDEGVIELAGKVSGSSRTGDRIACDRLVLKTEQEGNRFEWARAEGNVRGVLVSSVGGPAAAGGAVRTPPGERRYTADQAALLFAPEGSVRSLSLSGKPAHVEERDRKVDAEEIGVAFTAGRATSARARGHVRMDAPQNHAESESASLAFSPSGEIETLELAGGVRMEGDGRSARAEKAVELPARGLWILTGGEGGSATVESEGSRVSAASIELDKTRRTLDAQGNARAVFVPGKTKQKVPTLVGDSSRPTYGKSARMVFDDASHVAALSGGATLWQGASSLYGDDITINDAERTLVAVGHTRTVVSPEPGEARSPEDRNPSVVTARRVIYREAEGTALFEGDITVTRGARRATSQKATAILARDRKIERVEMTGDVSLVDAAAGRTGKAARAVDWPPLDKTVLEGSPAWVTDAEGNRVSGATLTITEGGRRVEVTAPEGGKTETIHKTRKQ
jgi:lipopolysaccharide export system protein LptA